MNGEGSLRSFDEHVCGTSRSSKNLLARLRHVFDTALVLSSTHLFPAGSLDFSCE